MDSDDMVFPASLFVLWVFLSQLLPLSLLCKAFFVTITWALVVVLYVGFEFNRDRISASRELIIPRPVLKIENQKIIVDFLDGVLLYENVFTNPISENFVVCFGSKINITFRGSERVLRIIRQDIILQYLFLYIIDVSRRDDNSVVKATYTVVKELGRHGLLENLGRNKTRGIDKTIDWANELYEWEEPFNS